MLMADNKLAYVAQGNFERVPGLPQFRPLRIAVVAALGYLILCGFYIWLSGIIAASLAESVTELQEIETIKGMAFIGVTTTALFISAWALLSRLATAQAKISQQQQALIQSEKRAVAGLFAASVAHDINNILTVLAFYCEELSQTEAAKAIDDRIGQNVAESVHDLRELATRLMDAGKENLPGEFSDFDLAELAANTADFLRKHKNVRDCSVNIAGDKSLAITGQPNLVRQMLANLIINAAAATNGKGTIEVNVSHADGNAVIEVHDNGPGIPEDKRSSVLQAFYTTKEHGAGLGLLSVKVYTEAHKGAVEILDSPLGGACFRVTLPMKRDGNAATPNPTPR